MIVGAGPGALSDAAIKAAEDLHSQGVVTIASFRPYFGLAVPTPQTEKMWVKTFDCVPWSLTSR